MNETEQTTCALIFGRKGSGKTTLMRKCIKHLEGTKTILIVDKMNKYSDMADFRCKDAFEFAYYCNEEILEPMGDRITNHIVVLDSTEENDIIATFQLAYLFGNFTIFMDEADLTFGRKLHPILQHVIYRGRNQGLDFIFATVRPMALNIDVRNQIGDILYIFNFKNKEAIKSIVQEFGTKETLESMIKALKQFEYVKYDSRTDEIEVYQKEFELPPLKEAKKKKKSKKAS